MTSLYLLLQSDLFRITGVKKNRLSIYYNLYRPEFRYLFFLRHVKYHYLKKNKVRYYYYRFFLRYYSIKYGYEIPYQCNIEPGLKLMHYGGVIINPLAKIGRNVTLLRGCTIGSNRRGKKKGAPTIGNNVWVGANAAIIGKINIGNNVMVAPNAYINVDLPSNSICVGNPAKIIPKLNATEFYIDNPI